MAFGNDTTMNTASLKDVIVRAPFNNPHLDPERNAYNPPFDRRLYNEHNAGGVANGTPKLLRGRISMWATEVVPPYGVDSGSRKSRSLNFLYNPTTITHSYSFDSSAVNYSSRNAEDTASSLMQGQSISWVLYFNRQYEVATIPNHSGCLADTAALEYMLGSDNGQGVQAKPCIVVFGTTLFPMVKPFAFYGWVVDCSIDYKMFSPTMIPTIAEVKITLGRKTLPNKEAGDSPPPDSAQAAAQQKAIGEALLEGDRRAAEAAVRNGTAGPSSTWIDPVGVALQQGAERTAAPQSGGIFRSPGNFTP